MMTEERESLEPSLQNFLRVKEEISYDIDIFECKTEIPDYFASDYGQTVTFTGIDNDDASDSPLRSLPLSFENCDTFPTQVVKKEPFQCSGSAVFFANEPDVSEHLTDHSRITREPFRCTTCGKSFTNSAVLTEHKCLRKRKPIMGELCGEECLADPAVGVNQEEQMFDDSPAPLKKVPRKNVSRKKFPLKKKYHECLDCGALFPLFSSFVLHKRSHDAETSLSYQDSKKTLKRKRDKPDKHDQLGRLFELRNGKRLQISLTDLRNNPGNKSNGDQQKQFKCSQCAKSFETISAFESHLREEGFGLGLGLGPRDFVQSEQKTPKCDICGECFTYTSALILHKRTHSGENHQKPTNVDQGSDPSQLQEQPQTLEASFVKNEELTERELTHIGDHPEKRETRKIVDQETDIVQHEKLHTCNLCGKSFTLSVALTAHKRWHTRTKRRFLSQRPIQASDDILDECVLGFPPQCSPTEHKRIHSVENTQRSETSTLAKKSDFVQKKLSEQTLRKCELCEKSFSNASQLKVHIRSHTGEKPFECKDCAKRFTTNSDLVRHERTHSGARPYKCEVCEKSYSDVSHLIAHRRSHSGEKLFKCEECGKRFTCRSSLIVHGRFHTGEKPFTCKDCGKSFAKKSDCVRHELTHLIKIYKCEECGKIFTRRSAFNLHGRVHSGEKPFTCEDCGKSFFRKSDLSRHSVIHLKKGSLKCDVCSKHFSDKSHLRAHLLVHTKEGHKCKECGKSFTCNSSLTAHERIHSGEKSFTCGDCGLSFGKKTKLVRHSFVHVRTGIENKCADCDACFIDQYELKVHRRIHTGETPHHCEHCGKGFACKCDFKRIHTEEISPVCKDSGKEFPEKSETERRPDSLTQKAEEPDQYDENIFTDGSHKEKTKKSKKEHLTRHKRTHTVKKTYPCETCSKSFKKPAHLLRHSRIHTGERTHQCETCGKLFQEPSSLNRHRLLHSGVKPYECKDCGKSFAILAYLNQHRKEHTEGKPFECEHCQKTFALKSVLRGHILSHFGIRRFVCDCCGQKFGQKSKLKRHKLTHLGERLHQCVDCEKRFATKYSLKNHKCALKGHASNSECF